MWRLRVWEWYFFSYPDGMFREASAESVSVGIGDDDVVVVFGMDVYFVDVEVSVFQEGIWEDIGEVHGSGFSWVRRRVCFGK